MKRRRLGAVPWFIAALRQSVKCRSPVNQNLNNAIVRDRRSLSESNASIHQSAPTFFPALSALFLLFAATLLPGQQAWADELLMKDGSRLIGEVVKRENGTLEFKTSYAGVIKVKWDEVAELHADEPMKLMLDDESIRTAKHIKSSEDGLIVYDDDIEPDLSEPSLAQDELAYINPDPWRTGDGYKLDGHINFALTERAR